MRPIVYIAGPISDADCIVMLRNLYRFTQAEHALLRAGYAPINPAADAAAVALGGVDYEALMERDRALLAVCDVVYFLRGWKASTGAVREHRWAKRLQIACVEEPPDGFEVAGFGDIARA